jgi:hypothetical protein
MEFVTRISQRPQKNGVLVTSNFVGSKERGRVAAEQAEGEVRERLPSQ